MMMSRRMQMKHSHSGQTGCRRLRVDIEDVYLLLVTRHSGDRSEQRQCTRCFLGNGAAFSTTVVAGEVFTPAAHV
eukprot:1254476-Lingulodinium_polyedra.AAC.1